MTTEREIVCFGVLSRDFSSLVMTVTAASWLPLHNRHSLFSPSLSLEGTKNSALAKALSFSRECGRKRHSLHHNKNVCDSQCRSVVNRNATASCCPTAVISGKANQLVSTGIHSRPPFSSQMTREWEKKSVGIICVLCGNTYKSLRSISIKTSPSGWLIRKGWDSCHCCKRKKQTSLELGDRLTDYIRKGMTKYF